MAGTLEKGSSMGPGLSTLSNPVESAPRVEIDTSAPFESVREAATHFGGFGFWKPSQHRIQDTSQENDFEEVDNRKLEAQVVELEKELIEKEHETLQVLEELKDTKAIVEDLKSKLQDKEASDQTKILMDANLSLCRTTEDLTDIRISVELLYKKLEEEQTALEKARERLAREVSKCGRFVKSRERVNWEVVRERDAIKMAEKRLIAARKMREAARAVEAVAIAEIKAMTTGKKRLDEAEEATQMCPNLRHEGSSTMSIGQILSKKLLMAEEMEMNVVGGEGRTVRREVSLGQMLGKMNNGGSSVRKKSVREENGKMVNKKRKKFGFGNLTVLLNKENHKKKKIDLR